MLTMKNKLMVALSNLSILTKAAGIKLEVEVVIVALVVEAKYAPKADPVLAVELGLKAELAVYGEVLVR
ncbi:hypothetical protein CDL15_Pgr005631 [Punica granatum]|uniref:Uncharacterized protein n=1 Tax=Punica granatum TaxID=22663 RepID=A0A218WF33_PUNGR|nr:hypothetical protein CDL15_Pgr005631 [Punica granatum]